MSDLKKSKVATELPQLSVDELSKDEDGDDGIAQIPELMTRSTSDGDMMSLSMAREVVRRCNDNSGPNVGLLRDAAEFVREYVRSEKGCACTGRRVCSMCDKNTRAKALLTLIDSFPAVSMCAPCTESVGSDYPHPCVSATGRLAHMFPGCSCRGNHTGVREIAAQGESR